MKKIPSIFFHKTDAYYRIEILINKTANLKANVNFNKNRR